jgi:GH35 family endo-1,4-beta-xylanase
MQSDAWERAGLTLSQRFGELMNEGTELFLDAAQRRGDPAASAKASLEAINILEQAIVDLGESYATQSIAFRKQREPQLGTLLAGTVIPPSPVDSLHADKFCTAFNAASVRLNWAEIETDAGRYDFEKADKTVRWCAANGLRVIGGPLIDFREKLLPHWLYLLEDDFESFLT